VALGHCHQPYGSLSLVDAYLAVVALPPRGIAPTWASATECRSVVQQPAHSGRVHKCDLTPSGHPSLTGNNVVDSLC
jgi:hypothetical protein